MTGCLKNTSFFAFSFHLRSVFNHYRFHLSLSEFRILKHGNNFFNLSINFISFVQCVKISSSLKKYPHFHTVSIILLQCMCVVAVSKRIRVVVVIETRVRMRCSINLSTSLQGTETIKFGNLFD